MAIIHRNEAPVFNLPDLTVTGLASPNRGASETCVWHIRLAPRAPGVPHSVTREEIFVAVAGEALVRMEGKELRLRKGDALVVPPHTDFALANPSAEPFEAVVSFPRGGQAVTDEGSFTPPWAE